MLLEFLQWVMQSGTIYLLLLALMISWYALSSKTQKLPPGPKAWPLLGNIPYVRQGNKTFNDRLMDLYREYGEIATLKLGTETIVFLFGSKMIHKAGVEQNEDFKFRPEHLYAFNKVFHKRGIVFGNGDVHTYFRKFTVVALKDFGVGKKTIEDRIHQETEILVRTIEKTDGKPVCFNDMFTIVMANVISNIIFGSRYEYDDQHFKEFIDQLSGAFGQLSYFMPENYLPFLVHFPGSKLKKILVVMERLKQYVREHIQEHRQSFDPNYIRDFVDIYLQKEGSDDEISEDDVFDNIMELFNGGVHTMAAALLWAVLYLTKHQDVQLKCRTEIQQVTGHGRLDPFRNKNRFPYLEATINETLRLSGDVTLALRAVLKDTKFAGYDIPKNTIIIMSLYSAMMDPDFWSNPHEFKPDRFLSKEGKLEVPKQNFIPFGLGGRVCAGEDLARMELKIILGTLLQRFKFEFPDNGKQLDTSRHTDGVVCRPAKYTVCAKPVSY